MNPIPAAAVIFFRDGNAWYCVRGDFQNLQESDCGFGPTPADALAELSNLDSTTEHFEDLLFKGMLKTMKGTP